MWGLKENSLWSSRIGNGVLNPCLEMWGWGVGKGVDNAVWASLTFFFCMEDFYFFMMALCFLVGTKLASEWDCSALTTCSPGVSRQCCSAYCRLTSALLNNKAELSQFSSARNWSFRKAVCISKCFWASRVMFPIDGWIYCASLWGSWSQQLGSLCVFSVACPCVENA